MGLFGLLLLLSLFSAAEAQVRTIEILNADEGVTETDSISGETSILRGNVRLRSDTTSLRAARATITNGRRNAVLEGSVRIVSGDDTLTADRVTYDASTKQAIATGSVRIGADGGILYAPRATYNSRDKRATFEGGGRILQDGAELLAPSGTYETERRFAELDGPLTLRDSITTLTAARGTYDARSRRADVVGSVRLVREADHLDADSLVYFRRTERARAFGEVVLDRPGEDADSLRRGLLFGNRLVYDGQAESASMTAEGGPALAVLLERDSTGTVDTTLVRAFSFTAAREARDSLRAEILTAAGEAQLWRDGLGAVADSVAFVRLAPADSLSEAPSRDQLDLYGGALGLARPTVWVRGSQLVGDSLRILTGALRDSVFATGSAFAGRLDSTLGRVQQLAGERMIGIVRDEALRRLHVGPAAEAIVYEATPEGRLGQALQIGVDSLIFHFDARGEIREIRGGTNVEGTSWSGAIVPPDLRLSSFTFDPDRRPRRADLLTGWEAAWLDANPDWRRPPPDALEPPDTVRLGPEAEEVEPEPPAEL